jgi:hypothetical protein
VPQVLLNLTPVKPLPVSGKKNRRVSIVKKEEFYFFSIRARLFMLVVAVGMATR